MKIRNVEDQYLRIADEIYPNIAESTQSFLEFNDKYDCGDHCNHLESLATDLSALGERLADRIEYEDKLIAVLVSPRG